MSFMKEFLDDDGRAPNNWRSIVSPDSKPDKTVAISQLPVDDELDKLVDRENLTYAEATKKPYFYGGAEAIELGMSRNKDGLSVSLGERAIELNSAIWAGSKHNSAVAYESVLRNKKPERDYKNIIERTIEQQKAFEKQFYEAFYSAIGLKAVIAAGYNPDLALSEANTMAVEFKKTYLGPENKHAREKYRKVLENFQK